MYLPLLNRSRPRLRQTRQRLSFCPQPYLQCILLLFLLRWLEIRYGGRTVTNDRFCGFVFKPERQSEPGESNERT